MGIPLEPEVRSRTIHPAVLCLLALLCIALAVVILRISGGPKPRVMAHEVPATVSASSGVTTRADYSHSDLVIEVDRTGRTLYKNQSMPLAEAKPSIRRALQHISPNSEAVIQVEEGCRYEFVDHAVRMYKELGVASPQITTVPPRRAVMVTLDVSGKATVDGLPVDDPQNALRQIALKHGSRATVKIVPDPKCPVELVLLIAQACKDNAFGEVQIEPRTAPEKRTEAVMEASH